MKQHMEYRVVKNNRGYFSIREAIFEDGKLIALGINPAYPIGISPKALQDDLENFLSAFNTNFIDEVMYGFEEESFDVIENEEKH